MMPHFSGAMARQGRARQALAGAVIGVAMLLSGCAQQLRVPSTPDSIQTQTQTRHWEGRMSLQTQGEQAQGFAAGFDLKGTPQAGELVLATPLGTVLGVLRWAPGEAMLQTGTDVKRFASVDELLEQTTGAAVPLPALFDWLEGKDTVLNGWQADLSQQPTGRISARRTDPAPVADLRIVLSQ